MTDGLQEKDAEIARLSKALDATWRKVIAYRMPQVCKHLVAANMLSDMEELGFEVPQDLAKAVVWCDDETALAFPPLRIKDQTSTG